MRLALDLIGGSCASAARAGGRGAVRRDTAKRHHRCGQRGVAFGFERGARTALIARRLGRPQASVLSRSYAVTASEIPGTVRGRPGLGQTTAGSVGRRRLAAASTAREMPVAGCRDLPPPAGAGRRPWGRHAGP
jgi:hypothetical protein